MKPIRSAVKVVIFGHLRSGKTKILECLLNQAFSPTYEATIYANVHQQTHPENHTRLTFFDCTGNPQHKHIVRGTLIGTDIGLYCINLSQEIDLAAIKKNINAYHEATAHSKTLICIGTHADQLDGTEQKIIHLQNELLHLNVKKLLLTSVKDNSGIDDLKNYFFEECSVHFKQINQQLLWKDAVKKLKLDLLLSPALIQQKVLNALDELTLKINLSSPNLDTKKRAIDDFVTTCRPLLINTSPKIMTRVLSIATVAIVTLIGAAIGFVIGSITGAITGPAGSLAIGALVGFIMGCACADSVEKLITTHGFFANSKHCKPNPPTQSTNPIDEFAASI